jgi:hypothetical protein
MGIQVNNGAWQIMVNEQPLPVPMMVTGATPNGFIYSFGGANLQALEQGNNLISIQLPSPFSSVTGYVNSAIQMSSNPSDLPDLPPTWVANWDSDDETEMSCEDDDV